MPPASPAARGRPGASSRRGTGAGAVAHARPGASSRRGAGAAAHALPGASSRRGSGAGAWRGTETRPGAVDHAFAVTAAAALSAYNNVVGRHAWHDRWYVPLNAGATAAVLAAATASGLTGTDLGLGPDSWRLGRSGTGLVGAVTAGWLLIATVPATRPVLSDKRSAGLNGRKVAYQAAVRIPIGTVLWEEIAFRGVLQASLRRVLSPPSAIAVTSGIFGLWHIRPTWQALRTNGLVTNRRQAAARVSVICVGMAAAGAILSWLREDSGGLAAPIALHLATNSGGAVTAWAVRSRQNPDHRYPNTRPSTTATPTTTRPTPPQHGDLDGVDPERG